MDVKRRPLYERKQVRPFDKLRRPLPPATLRRILEKNGFREEHHYAVFSTRELTGRSGLPLGPLKLLAEGAIVGLSNLPLLHFWVRPLANAISADIERKKLLELKPVLRAHVKKMSFRGGSLPEYAALTADGASIFVLTRDAAAAIRTLKKNKATVNIWKLNDPQPYKPDSDPYGWLKRL